jgi:hypothetical protein
MISGSRALRWSSVLGIGMVAVGAAALTVRRPALAADFSGHAAVGSYFGEAVELCPVGTSPAACSPAGSALALYMTPTLAADGTFLGNDSFSLGSPPFGPHTTAHGQWVPTSPTEFTADYVFMLNSFPLNHAAPITGVRFRWSGTVVDTRTLQGFVNMYLQPPMPVVWRELIGDRFPVLPPTANGLITSPVGFVKDPTLCRTPGCPLVFKFTVKRVAP